VVRNAASRAMNSAVILAGNGISLWSATATASTGTEYSVGTGVLNTQRVLARVALLNSRGGTITCASASRDLKREAAQTLYPPRRTPRHKGHAHVTHAERVILVGRYVRCDVFVRNTCREGTSRNRCDSRRLFTLSNRQAQRSRTFSYVAECMLMRRNMPRRVPRTRVVYADQRSEVG
jgi:hypothetical protein